MKYAPINSVVIDSLFSMYKNILSDNSQFHYCKSTKKKKKKIGKYMVFLGQKYGYRPIPTYIVSSELELLREELVNVGSDVTLLDMWYRKDSNAVPPISVLQPISSILINFNNKRIPKLQQQDQAIWWDTLAKMQKLFRKSSISLFNSGKIDKDTMHNYYMSVTEREVINGILKVKNTKNHCLAYVRYINNINLQNLKKASNFLDIVNRSIDTEASRLLGNLRDERLVQKIETTNFQKYTVEWIGREGLDTETHQEYLQNFIMHFYKNITKLVDRAMRKEDSSPQGQIVTEILQHLHACHNSVKVFYGREDSLKHIEQYMKSKCEKPMILFGEGGCGKTSLLAKAAGLSYSTWFNKTATKPLCVIRFLGTTPDSSTLTPALISICQQISYNYMLPFDDIPDDLVPLTAHFKHLLTYATLEQPLVLFLDSVDQLTGTQDTNNVSWLPTRLPNNCKLLVSVAKEEGNSDVSRDYHVLRRMIDDEEQFIEVTALGEELAEEVIRKWMETAHRDLTNCQWRLVSNAINQCSLPIFVKLVFAEICRWRSYTKPQETHLASNVMDSIMMLFERIEKQHGRLLVFHALAYITASKSGLSESELEDLISLDDKVLDDVYQYHLPPVRRIPPLLWTRIRNDLPNYLSEREADGVSVLNWYHRQFRDAARERYFKNMNMVTYFHSSIADYYLGIWGGGNPKPFKYTEIQRHRFNLQNREGSADRKVPVQPLVFYSKEGTASRYNLRKFGELPYHLVRAHRFQDLYKNVLFNYQWLHAKLSSCPLQAVLSDFEDACANIDDRDATRELILVADALRLGGAILSEFPDMLAPQLIGRLLPEIGSNPNIKSLLAECDKFGPDNCALIPYYHCLHTPGGPLKYSLEGHQFAVFDFQVTSDYRYIVSISNRFITWDLSTSDMTRNVNPGLEGIMQALCLSPDNRYAAAYTNNNQTVLLNCLTSEFIVIENPFENGEMVSGVNMLNTHLFVHGSFSLCRYDLRGNLESKITTNEDPNQWVLMSVKFTTLTCNRFIFWSGRMDDTRMMMQTTKDNNTGPKFYFHSAMAINKEETRLYCCPTKNSYDISQFDFIDNEWKLIKDLEHISNCTVLQIKLSEDSSSLLGTISNGFCIWDLSSDGTKVLHLPHGVRNITINMMQSNSCMLSADKRFLVAGVRKMLYVWNMETELLIKVLDAHFGRIISLLPLTTGNWNSVITSSIDRSVKVWNINNIFEQVHVIDRHELQIDSISLSHSGLAATVTRGCVGIWDINTGRLIQQLADNLLGAIVTQALITPDGKYIVCSESGNLLIWNRILCRVIFKQQQPGIQQIMLLDEATKCLTVSKQEEINVETQQNIDATAIVRSIPDGKTIYLFDYQVRNVTGMEFKELVVTADGLNLIALASDKGHREALHIFNASNGEYVTKIVLKQSGMKDIMFIVAMPHRANLVAVINPDKGMLFDIRTKKFLKSVPKWGGFCTKDGKYGLYAPTRGGLELLELKKGSSVKTFIPRVAEGVFTVICMFNKTDEYVLYYHSGKKTLRVFRLTDAKMLANYRVPAELSAIETTEDGRAVVIATVDGCLTVLAIADPNKNSFLSALPSRDETWKKKMDKQRTAKLFKAAAAITKFCVSVNEPNLKEEVGNNINSSQLIHSSKILSKG